MAHLLGKLYRTSPQTLVTKLERLAGRPGDAVVVQPKRVPRPVTRSFLESAAYGKLMSRHLAFGDDGGLHEAQHDTASYRFRHFEAFDRLGVFRWRGVQRHLKTILDTVAPLDAQPRVIDFGGAACPLGLGSMLVDLLPEDVYGQPVPYHALSDIEGEVDAIFCSHTLEHVEPLDDVLSEMVGKLRPGGRLILHVPAWTCEGWRAGTHRNDLHRDHVWTFGLSESTDLPNDTPDGLPRYRAFDMAVARHARVELAAYCGDDSIMVVAER